MAFWKKLKGAIVGPDDQPEKSEDPKPERGNDEARSADGQQRSDDRQPSDSRTTDEEPRDPLNDPVWLRNMLIGQGMPMNELSQVDTTLYLHMFRQYIWATGVHPPLAYPIELEPPYKFMRVPDSILHDPPNIYPRRYRGRRAEDTCCFTIAISPSDSMSASQAEQFWLSLRNISEPVNFEIVANSDEIVYQFLCHQRDRQYIAGQLAMYCPESDINPEGDDPDYFSEWFYQCFQQFGEETLSYPCELGTFTPYYKPLRIYTNLDPDPLGALINVIGDLNEGDGFVFQALIVPTRNDWKQDLSEIFLQKLEWRDVLTFVGDEDRQLVREKLRSYPFFAVALRMMLFGKARGTSPLILQQETIKCFEQYRSNHNYIFPLHIEQYPDCEMGFFSGILTEDIVARWTRRGGMLLSPKELAGICHFPARSLQHPKLVRATHAIAKAPDIALQGGVAIGVNTVHGRQREVSIPDDHRDLHAYIVGATGTGKSTLLLNMISQDINSGRGVGVIDPHGDLISDILPCIPDNRTGDVILFDPADSEYPIGLNLLSASGYREMELVCSDLLTVFQRMFDTSSWGDNIEQILRMAILSLLEVGGYTLRDIRRMLTNDVLRSDVVSRLSDVDLVEFWAVEFPGYSKSSIGAVQRRLSRVLSTPIVRNILSQRESKLDFLDIMDSGKILLCNLSKGNIGQDNSDLFGQLLISKIQVSSMARASRPKEHRRPFYLYVDEFQNFVTSSFEEILSEARKYQLCLILANQFTRQLSKRVHDAVFGNVGTLVTFRLGLDDAQDLQKELGRFTYENILNLEPYHTYVKIGRAQDTFSMQTLPPPNGGDTSAPERIRDASRRKYATPRTEVEDYLRAEIEMPYAGEQQDTGERKDELDFFEKE